MTYQIFQLPKQTLIGSAAIKPSWKVSFFLTGTTTPTPVYTTSALSVAHTQPVQADSGGVLATVYLDPSIVYKASVYDQNDVLQYTVDPVNDAVVSQASIGALLYPRTAAEISAGVTPTNYMYPSHEALGYVHPFRYMSSAMVTSIVSGSATVDTAASYTSIFAFCATASLPCCIPAGRSRIESAITVPQTAGFTLFGFGDKSVIEPHGTFTNALVIGDTAAQSIRGDYRDFLIDCITGAATVQNGIYFARAEEHNFTRVKVWGAKAAGCSNGFGYVNNYNECEFSYGVGTSGFGSCGLATNQAHAAGGNNAINVVNCLLFNNEGFGLWARGSYNINVRGCTIEENDKGGMYLDGAAATGIRENYFEDNAVTGYAFTTPSKTVKADIILVGTGVAAEMGAAFPTHGVTVENCHSSTIATQTCFLWNAGANDVEINNCTTNQPTVPLYAEYYNPAYKGRGVTIRGCTDYTTQVLVTDAASAVNNTNAAYFDIFSPAKEFTGRNYANTDFNQWASVVGGGSASTLRRSQSSSLYKRHGLDVWEINSTASGSSDAYGFTIDSALYPELSGKLFWFGIWCYTGAADPYVVPYCSAQTFNNNPTATSAWTLVAASFVWPASGTLTFGAYKAGSNTGSVYVSAPMLGVVGTPSDELIAAIQKGRVWYGTAAPTTGTWERGDWVINSTPSAAGVPGWVCTTAGTPGTWKAMAAVAA